VKSAEKIGWGRASLRAVLYLALGVFVLAFSDAGRQPWTGILIFFALTWLFQIHVSRRPWGELGLSIRPQAAAEWGIGAALGLALVSVILGTLVAAGSAKIALPAAPPEFSQAAVPLAFYALVEEMLFRGYPLVMLARALGPIRALGIVSLVFAAAHLENPSSGIMAFAGVFLAGAVMGAIVLRWRSLWAAWGFHFAWNFAQGAIFGLPISGVDDLVSGPLRVTRLHGPAWLTGGAFGAEAAAPTLLFLGATAWLLTYGKGWPSLREAWEKAEARSSADFPSSSGEIL
jgi:membrane protease YdiL (CAAX protease family)